MVTIEQKLSLFSKLLQQDIKNDISKQMEEIDEVYTEKIKVAREVADKQAEKMIQKASKKAEREVGELLSRSRMENKKELLLGKEKCIETCLDHLKERLVAYVASEQYKTYLLAAVKVCSAFQGNPNRLQLQLGVADEEKYSNYLLEQLALVGLLPTQIEVVGVKAPFIGGFILEDTVNKMRLDLSISNLIEEQKEAIAEAVLFALEKEA